MMDEWMCRVRFLADSGVLLTYLRSLLSSSFLVFVDSEKMQKHFESRAHNKGIWLIVPRPFRRLCLLLQSVDPGAFLSKEAPNAIGRRPSVVAGKPKSMTATTGVRS